MTAANVGPKPPKIMKAKLSKGNSSRACDCAACARGDKHPSWFFSIYHKRKQQSLYVPEDLVVAVGQAITNGRKVEQLLAECGAAQEGECSPRPTQKGCIAGPRITMSPPRIISPSGHCARCSSSGKSVFGSQPDAGAKTREILMTIVPTLKQRFGNFQTRFKNALDHLAQNPNLDACHLLFQQPR